MVKIKNTSLKILAIGDFHGKIPGKLLRKIMKEKFDIIISPGDYCGDKELGRLFFKHVYGSGKKLWDVIGMKKYKMLEKRNFNSGLNVLKQLDSFKRPVIGVRGNWDYKRFVDIGYKNDNDKNIKKFEKACSKLNNLNIIDFSIIKSEGFDIIGFPGGSYPGIANNKSKTRFIKRLGKKQGIQKYNKINNDNRKYLKHFNKLFKTTNNPVIFISHNCPYNSKIDVIKRGHMRGQHYGSWLTKEIIKKHKPKLVICGHMHEYQKVIKIGKTVVVNPGASVEGKAAMIDYPMNSKGKIKVRFIR